MNEQKFLSQFKEVLELGTDQHLGLNVHFQELEEWDSLAQLALIVMLDEEYKIEIEVAELEALITIEELINWIDSRE